MRIVGGTFRGHPLRGPASSLTRPTSDRVRETLFNILAHAYPASLDQARVLDLFAGTGALGLEALSRGAQTAVFVEEHPQARAIIRDNIEALQLTGRTKIFRRDATKLGECRFAPFTLVFCDPPYRQGLGERALSSAAGNNWLAQGAWVILEEASDAQIQALDGFTQLDQRRSADSTLTIFRYSASGE